MKLRDFLGNFTVDLRKVDWTRTVLLVLLILAIFAALWQYFMPQIRTITTTEFRRVPEIRTVHDIRRVYLPCPQQGIQVLDKKELSKKLDIAWAEPSFGAAVPSAEPRADHQGVLTAGEVLPLSPEGTTPSGVQVTATADLPATDNGYEELAVIEMYSGESQIVAREKEAPWFQFRNDGALGIRYGIDQRLTNVGDIYGRWDFLRIKDVYFSANANLETGGDAKLQLGAEYRW